ncbi:MAG: hypothetical protein AB1Z18_05520 [Desulfobacterales bacterium]
MRSNDSSKNPRISPSASLAPAARKALFLVKILTFDALVKIPKSLSVWSLEFFLDIASRINGSSGIPWHTFGLSYASVYAYPVSYQIEKKSGAIQMNTKADKFNNELGADLAAIRLAVSKLTGARLPWDAESPVDLVNQGRSHGAML